MIKAKTDNAVIIGLSDENMKRLSIGQPIKFNLKEMGFQDLDVVIFNGRTEESMMQELQNAAIEVGK